MSLTKPLKIFLSLNGKTGQKPTKTALAVCWMWKHFSQKLSAWYQGFMSAGCLQKYFNIIQTPSTLKNRNVMSKNIHQIGRKNNILIRVLSAFVRYKQNQSPPWKSEIKKTYKKTENARTLRLSAQTRPPIFLFSYPVTSFVSVYRSHL